MEQNLRLTPAALGAAARGDLTNFLVAATPGGIEAQEAQGQRDLVSSFTRLPLDVQAAGGEWRDTEHGWRVAELFGFKRGADIDELFCTVEAPTGWQLRPSDHSMHSDIIDDKDRVRGGVFYKAAFYDRRADANFTTRFTLKSVYPDTHDGSYTLQAFDTATGTVMGSTDIPPYGDRDGMTPEERSAAWTERDALETAARESMAAIIVEAGYPDWKKAEAYWD